MGSFANSLHVKTSDANRVASAIAAVLAKQGWRPSERQPDEDAVAGIASSLRALLVFQPKQDWIGVLDSDLMGVHSLAPLLARDLATHAIFVLVNDSDSWSYLLADPKGGVAEFDSAEGQAENFDEAGFAEATAGLAKLQKLMTDGTLQERMRQMHEQMAAEAPAEIRETQARLQSGQATPSDMQRYQAWAMGQMPKFVEQMNSLLGGAMGRTSAKTKRKPKRTTTKERAAQRKRLDALRPLLAAGITEQQVEAVFEKRVVFAEELLADFLPLLGISSAYAFFSYKYFQEAETRELAENQRIRVDRELRFERDAAPQ